MNIYYTMEPDELVVGLIHVVYKEEKTGDVLGGWEAIGYEWEEAQNIVDANLDEVAIRLEKYWNTDDTQPNADHTADNG